MLHFSKLRSVASWPIKVVILLAVPFGSGGLAKAALDPVELHCANVALNGDVTLTWTVPPDPGAEFGNYIIYWSSTALGPFVPIGNIGTWATTSYLHAGANADLGPQLYYITTVTNGTVPEGSLPSDTVSTIFLQVFQSAPPGEADLSWNALAVAPSADDTFSVWLEYPIGNWQLLADVATTTFTYAHVVSICDDSLTFRVERSDDQGCVSRSNLDGDVFQDATPPTSPGITTVTVDTLTGLATVDWEASTEGDTDGYIIVFIAPGGGAIIDTVFGQNNTSYEWDESLAGQGVESYTVAAFDTCLVGVPPSPNTSATTPPHSSIFLDHTYDQCAAQVQLSWTPYVGWPVQEYRIYMQVDAGPWSLLAVVGGSTTTYPYIVQPFRVYCFAVEASRGTGMASSLSNRTCLTTDYPGLPAFNYVRSVSVSGEQEITIIDSLDVTALVTGYRLERSVNGGPFEELLSQGPSLQPIITFIDTDVEPATSSYQYRVVVLDGCGAESVISNIGANILLRAIPDLQGMNTLEWNGYEDWAGVLQAHIIYRKIGTGPFTLNAALPADPWIYRDDVADLTASTGLFCYYVVALETGNPSGINASSQSNEACAVQQELVYIPNAFVVGGANPLFKPVFAYTDLREYEFSIINRWGQVFWTTNDPEQAWDGTAGGAQVPLGLYAYYCYAKNGAGRVFEKRGTVMKLTAVD